MSTIYCTPCWHHLKYLAHTVSPSAAGWVVLFPWHTKAQRGGAKGLVQGPSLKVVDVRLESQVQTPAQASTSRPPKKSRQHPRVWSSVPSQPSGWGRVLTHVRPQLTGSSPLDRKGGERFLHLGGEGQLGKQTCVLTSELHGPTLGTRVGGGAASFAGLQSGVSSCDRCLKSSPGGHPSTPPA